MSKKATIFETELFSWLARVGLLEGEDDWVGVSCCKCLLLLVVCRRRGVDLAVLVSMFGMSYSEHSLFSALVYSVGMRVKESGLE